MPTINLGRKKRTYEKHSGNDLLKKLVYNTPRWKALRQEKISTNPLCEHCLLKNRVVPAKEVHHKTPLDHRMKIGRLLQLAFDWDNLISLCKSCHREEHIRLGDEHQQY